MPEHGPAAFVADAVRQDPLRLLIAPVPDASVGEGAVRLVPAGVLHATAKTASRAMRAADR